MNPTTQPQAHDTLPPHSEGCAYDQILGEIRRMTPRVGPALAAALALEPFGAEVQAELAERLFNVIAHE